MGDKEPYRNLYFIGSKLEKLEAQLPTHLWYFMNTDAFSEDNSQQELFSLSVSYIRNP